jgi:hypothetical protein
MVPSMPGVHHRFERPVRATGAWSRAWPTWYRLIRIWDGLLVPLTMRRGYGNLVLLHVPGRRTGHDRSVLLGLLLVGDRRYLGHPNGDTGWTLNVRAASNIALESAELPLTRFEPIVLGPGPERDAVVRAAFRQHPFPGNAIYRLASRHVFTNGVFFRLERLERLERPLRSERPER